MYKRDIYTHILLLEKQITFLNETITTLQLLLEIDLFLIEKSQLEILLQYNQFLYECLLNIYKKNKQESIIVYKQYIEQEIAKTQQKLKTAQENKDIQKYKSLSIALYNLYYDLGQLQGRSYFFSFTNPDKNNSTLIHKEE